MRHFRSVCRVSAWPPELLQRDVCMNHSQLHPRMLVQEAFGYRRHDAGIHDLRTSDRKFARRRISQEFDLPQSLTHLIEDVDTAFEQRPPVVGQFDTLRGAIKQLYLEHLLEVGNRLGDHRMGDRKPLSRLRHAAGFRYGHYNVEIAQPDAPADPVRPFHFRTP